MRFLYCLLGCLLAFPVVSEVGRDDGNGDRSAAFASAWLGESGERAWSALPSASGERNEPVDEPLAEGFARALQAASARGGGNEVESDGYAWETAFFGPGFTSEVMVSKVWDDGGGPALYVGGQFSTAGKHRAFGIARWDGAEWTPLGLGVNGVVRDMIEFEGDLIVAGDFTQVAGDDGVAVEVNNIARWDGQAWSPLGAGFTGPNANDARVLALEVYEGELIAGGGWLPDGNQSTSWVAHWNGSTWLPLGDGVNNAVWDMVVKDGELFAAGTFDRAGGLTANGIARWDGQQWSTLGAGMNLPVIRLAVFEGELIAGGPFSHADGALVNSIARWDGNSWSSLHTGLVGAQTNNVRGFDVFDGELIVAGTFTHAGGQAANHIARWNGESWSPLNGPSGAGVSGIVGRTDLLAGAISTVSAFNGTLFAGGMFYYAGGVRANYVAQWDGDAWAPMVDAGTGLVNFSDINNGVARAVAEFDGKLIAAGGFDDAAGVADTDRIAAWDGTQWSALGTGVDVLNPAFGDWAAALALHDGDLIVGGIFSGVGGVAGTQRVARWDGVEWSSLDGGLSGAFPARPSIVEALLAFEGDLIAAGGFTQASGQTVNGIARWDGSQWSPLDTGFDGAFPGSCSNAGGNCPILQALAEFDGDLIAAGNFTHASGQVVNGIARWDGSQWQPLGSGVNSSINALGVFNGELFAAGGFTEAGGVSVNHIARWDGGQWSPVGDGLMSFSSSVGVRASAMTVFNGDLVVGGLFTHAGAQGETVAVNNIARWDGTRWWPLAGPAGTGVSGGPNNPWLFALGSYDSDGPGPGPRKLVAGGYQMLAGGAPSWGLGLYGPVPFTVAPSVLDFGALMAGDTAGPLSLTLSNNGDADVAVTNVPAPGAPFTAAGGSCGAVPFTLTPGTDCTLDFNFEPAAAGAATAMLTIASDAAGGGRQVELRGIASDTALAVTPEPLAFETVAPGDTSEAVFVTLTNADGATVNISGIDTPAAPFTAAGGSCGPAPFSLAPQDACTLAFVFEPEAAGNFADTLEITHDASGSPATVALAGESAQRTLALIPGTLDFGAVPVGDGSEPHALTLSNPGAVAVTVSGLSGPGAAFAEIGGSCGEFPRELSPGEQCMLNYSFAPEAVGSAAGELTVFSDTQPGSHTVDLQGSGSGAIMSAAPDGLSVVTGENGSETRTLVVANQGNDALNWELSQAPAAHDAVLRASGKGDAPVTITHSTSDEVIEGNGIACALAIPGAVYTGKNHFMRTFALDDFQLNQGFEVMEVTFGIEALNAQLPVDVNLYLLEGPMHFDNLTPIGQATEVLAPQGLSLVTIPVTASVPARATLVVELELPDVIGLAHFFPGANNLGESAPSYWASPQCNIDQPVPYETAGYAGVNLVMSVTGRAPVDCTLPDWVALTPSAGTVAAGDDQSVQVEFDAAGLASGSYGAGLCLQSNDPLQPVTVIPLSLTVNADILFQDRFE